jgi:hypothetical protein
MKKLFFILLLVCFGTTVSLKPLQAIQVPSASSLVLGACWSAPLLSSLGKTIDLFFPKSEKKDTETSDKIREYFGLSKDKELTLELQKQFFEALSESLRKMPTPRQKELFEDVCQKMGMDSKKIVLLKENDEADYKVLFNPSSGLIPIIKLGRDSEEVTEDELSFIFAHELAHMKHNDGQKSLGARAMLAGVSVLCAIPAAKSMLNFPKSPSTTAVGLAATYAFASSCLLDSVESFFEKQKEKRADLTAIVALKNKAGAIAYFNRAREKNIKSNDWRVDKEGNNKSDHKHPRLTERIAYCNAAL